MASWEFPAEDPVSLRLRVPDGSVTVTAARTAMATVTLDANGPFRGGDATGTRVEFDHGELSVIAADRASLTVTVELPEGSLCTMHTVSADVRCHGELGALHIHTASGDVSAGRVTGATEIVTASGDVYLGEGTEISLKTASGDIALGRASGVVSVNTASGDVRIGETSGSRTEVTATSGDVSVAVAPGAGVYLDLWTMSGDVSSELDPAEETSAADMTVTCRSISGDVRITRAARTAQR